MRSSAKIHRDFEIWIFWEIEILFDLTYENHRTSLNFKEWIIHVLDLFLFLLASKKKILFSNRVPDLFFNHLQFIYPPSPRRGRVEEKNLIQIVSTILVLDINEKPRSFMSPLHFSKNHQRPWALSAPPPHFEQNRVKMDAMLKISKKSNF